MLLAVVRVRGRRNVNPKIRKTLELLNLQKPNHCVLVIDRPHFLGMLKIVKDYVTFGPISEETLKLLVKKRGKKGRKKLNLSDEAFDELIKQIKEHGSCSREMKDKINPTFRLKPPSKGYKDIKRHFPLGDLGKRDVMDSLLRWMI